MNDETPRPTRDPRFDDVRYRQRVQQLIQRFFTHPMDGACIAVGAGANSLTITFPFQGSEPDALYGVVATAGWGSTVWVTNKTTTSFKLNFGTVAPGGGSTVDYITFRR